MKPSRGSRVPSRATSENPRTLQKVLDDLVEVLGNVRFFSI